MSEKKQSAKIVAENRRGWDDRQAKRPPTPPKFEPFRTAYLNGYYWESNH